jgi:hypothetical protein
MTTTLTREQVASAQLQGDFAIKSESSQPKLDTSEWPLLLKNYDKLLVRSSHFTPIPSGSSPLKRDLVSYIKWVSHKHFSLNTEIFEGRVWSTLTSLLILHRMKSWPGWGAFYVLRKLDIVVRLTLRSQGAWLSVLTALRDWSSPSKAQVSTHQCLVETLFTRAV